MPLSTSAFSPFVFHAFLIPCNVRLSFDERTPCNNEDGEDAGNSRKTRNRSFSFPRNVTRVYFSREITRWWRISTSRNENRICEIPVEKSFTKIWESLNNYTLNDTFIRFERFASFIIISINYYCHISNNRLSKLNLHASNFNYVKFSRSLSLDMIYDRKKGKKIPHRMVIARKGIMSKNAKQFRDSGTKCETVRELVRRQISLSNLHTRNLQTGVLHPSEGRDKEKEREGGGGARAKSFFASCYRYYTSH